jgi:hypothetical protein
MSATPSIRWILLTSDRPRKNTDVLSATFNVRPVDPKPRHEDEQCYTRYLADTSVAVGAISIGGRDSVQSPPNLENRRKPVFNFMKGAAMSYYDFLHRLLLAARLT